MKAINKWNLLKLAVFVSAASLTLMTYLGGIGSSPVLAWDFHGRMTGGGSFFTSDAREVRTDLNSDSRVTHGFELHCFPGDFPNNLEVNWKDSSGNAHRFHLENLINSAGESGSGTCFDDPNINPTPPGAGFDTYVGDGTGNYDGTPNAYATWVFTDAGEPGVNDTARITIWCCNGDASGTVVLSVPNATNLTYGNHQAHKNP